MFLGSSPVSGDHNIQRLSFDLSCDPAQRSPNKRDPDRTAIVWPLAFPLTTRGICYGRVLTSIPYYPHSTSNPSHLHLGGPTDSFGVYVFLPPTTIVSDKHGQSTARRGALSCRPSSVSIVMSKAIDTRSNDTAIYC